jgi:hypothetical protein
MILTTGEVAAAGIAATLATAYLAHRRDTRRLLDERERAREERRTGFDAGWMHERRTVHVALLTVSQRWISVARENRDAARMRPEGAVSSLAGEAAEAHILAEIEIVSSDLVLEKARDLAALMEGGRPIAEAATGEDDRLDWIVIDNVRKGRYEYLRAVRYELGITDREPPLHDEALWKEPAG